MGETPVTSVPCSPGLACGWLTAVFLVGQADGSTAMSMPGPENAVDHVGVVMSGNPSFDNLLGRRG